VDRGHHRFRGARLLPPGLLPQLLAPPPISRAHRAGLLPCLRARRRVHREAPVGFCLNVAADPGPFVLHHVNLYVDGIEISHPELYNDGRYVVHGLHGFVPPLSHTSCYEAEHHHHLTAKLATSSAATAASVVRIMIRDAISRLRDGGFGFVALAMRVKFAELEKFSNLTVFALDDQAIFTGRGHDYVSSAPSSPRWPASTRSSSSPTAPALARTRSVSTTFP
jgi:hypothetical protein